MSLIFKKKRIVILLAPIFFYSQQVLSACTPSGSTLTTDNTLYYCSNPESYDKVIINTTSDGKTAGLQGFGIYSDRNLHLKEVEINTSGSKADAIQVNRPGDLTIDKLTVITSGQSADGINLTENQTTDTTVTIGDNAYIETTHALSGMGIRSNISATAGSTNTIKVGNGLTIITHGSASNLFDGYGYGVYAGIRTLSASGAQGNAKVILGDDSQITTYGSLAHAVYANRGGDIQLGSTTITTNNTNAYGLYAETGSAGGSNKGSSIDLLSDVTVTVPTSGTAIFAKGADSVIASRDSISGSDTSGIYHVTGNIKADSSGLVDLRMEDGTLIQGNTSITDSGIINFDLRGTSSKWAMTENSSLTNLTLANNAKVVIGEQGVALDGTNSVTLTTENLSGNGIFEMRSEIDGSNNYHDLLKITGINASNGDHQIIVNDSLNGSSTVDGSERVKLVETEGGTANFIIKSASGYVDIGAYQYELGLGDLSYGERESDWHLRSTGGHTNPADNSVSLMNINYLMNYIETQTLLQRLGELRQSDNEEGNVWGRIYAGTLNSFDQPGLSNAKLRYSGLQLGVDKHLSLSEISNMYFGFLVGMSKGITSFNVGDGNSTSYYLGAYSTYKHDNGVYFDVVAKYMRMDNKFNTTTSGGYAVNGKGTTDGYTMSLELGKRFWIHGKPTEDSGRWFIEPQGQISYGYQGNATITASNGLKTDLHDFDSILGRISTLIGYSTYDKNTNKVDLYFKIGYVKEFDGDTAYVFNDTTKETYSFGGHWLDAGIGINAQIHNQHNLYLDVNYAKGDRFDQSQVNVGYRYTF